MCNDPPRRVRKGTLWYVPYVSISHERVLNNFLTRICNDSPRKEKKEHCGTFLTSLFNMNAYWLIFLTRKKKNAMTPRREKRTLWYVHYYVSISNERVLTNYFDQNMQCLPGREKKRTLGYVPYYVSISYECVFTNYSDQNMQWLPRRKKREHCGTFPMSPFHMNVYWLTDFFDQNMQCLPGRGKKEHCGTFLSPFHMNAYWLTSLTRICNPPPRKERKKNIVVCSLYPYFHTVNAYWLIFLTRSFAYCQLLTRITVSASFWTRPMSGICWE